MQYQLPNGKVIYMSVEEYLSLSDDELSEIARIGYYDEEPNHKSYAKGNNRIKKINTEEELDRSLDYKEEYDDDYDSIGPIDYDNLD